MKIMVFGAGAIGSLFGSFLAKNHEVVLFGRDSHVAAIKENGLEIFGKTKMKTDIRAESSLKNVDFSPDLVLLTVKSYDTESAIKQALDVFNDNTVVLSLQNGLGNIDVLKKYVDNGKIIAGITTHGAFFSKPGVVEHTGFGETVIGKLDSDDSFVRVIVDLFNNSGIVTSFSSNIVEDIWIKAIVNSSINPLTVAFQCKNGYLLDNPVLKGIVKRVCYESTCIANAQGLNLSSKAMFDKTVDVIQKTSENHSSMFQSFIKGNRTEIDAINGRLVEIGKAFKVDTLLNQSLCLLVESKI